MRFVPFAFLSCALLSLPAAAQWMTVSPETTVCRAGECVPAGTQDPYLLFEQIQLMLKTNMGQSVTMCNGVQSCVDKGLSVPVSIGGTARLLTVSHATMVDVSKESKPPKMNLILAYETRLNNFTPVCQSSNTQLDMTVPQIGLTSEPFACALTGKTTATVQLGFALDTIDLDNAVLGGSYTLTVSGAAVGQTAGHALLTFDKKTPVTLDEKSIGLRQPDKAALLEQARADVQAKHQQRIFEQFKTAQPNETEIRQLLAQTGGQDGIYPVLDWQPVAVQPVVQPVVYEQPMMYQMPVMTAVPTAAPTAEVIYLQQ